MAAQPNFPNLPDGDAAPDHAIVSWGSFRRALAYVRAITPLPGRGISMSLDAQGVRIDARPPAPASVINPGFLLQQVGNADQRAVRVWGGILIAQARSDELQITRENGPDSSGPFVTTIARVPADHQVIRGPQTHAVRWDGTGVSPHQFVDITYSVDSWLYARMAVGNDLLPVGGNGGAVLHLDIETSSQGSGTATYGTGGTLRWLLGRALADGTVTQWHTGPIWYPFYAHSFPVVGDP